MRADTGEAAPGRSSESTVAIGLLFPDALGTYGDSGNAVVLRQRLRWRGIPARIVPVSIRDAIPTTCDLYVLGGGEDASQRLAADRLRGVGPRFRGHGVPAPVLAVCAGMQVLGESFTGADGQTCPGLGLIDITTVSLRRRAVGEIAVHSTLPLFSQPLRGFENHLGATTIGSRARPLGRVIAGVGNGNGADGAIEDRVIGTYLHGPVLARNPALADLLLEWALGHPLAALPDAPCSTRTRRKRGQRETTDHVLP